MKCAKVLLALDRLFLDLISLGAQTQSQCDGKIEKNMFRARGLPPVKYDTRIRPDTVTGPNRRHLRIQYCTRTYTLTGARGHPNLWV